MRGDRFAPSETGVIYKELYESVDSRAVRVRHGYLEPSDAYTRPHPLPGLGRGLILGLPALLFCISEPSAAVHIHSGAFQRLKRLNKRYSEKGMSDAKVRDQHQPEAARGAQIDYRCTTSWTVVW
jgi:hypothetical protein